MSIQLDPNRPEPISGERKEQFEALRNNRVPRYLFRAWALQSGGGSNACINSPTTLIPHGFMPGSNPKAQSFYETAENVLRDMAYHHYIGVDYLSPASPFSSWASSLHLVLCYAMYLQADKEPHVAVMDRLNLDNEVLVWHMPHLIGDGYEEYLAHGCISGPGYKAVSLRELERNGLLSIFPELRRKKAEGFGRKLHFDMFRQAPKSVEWEELNVIRGISSLFGRLSLPVAAALANIRPRPEVTWAGMQSGKKCPAEIKRDMKSLAWWMGISEVPLGLSAEVWLIPGMVYTDGFCDLEENRVDVDDFRDVEQWIRMLYVWSQCSLEPTTHAEGYPPKQSDRKRKRDEDEGDARDKEADDEGDDARDKGVDEEKNWQGRLRPRGMKRLKFE